MVELIDELLWRSGHWVQGRLDQVALALVATLLVVFGGFINRHVARMIRPYPWLLRLSGFVLICVFGYGFATVWATPLMAELLRLIETRYLGLAVLGAFLAIGVLAERNNQI